MTNLLLVFHLLGAACFFVGGAVVGVLQLKAIRQERPSRVYALLRRAPFGAALVGAGALLTLGFGIALAEHKGLGLSPAWIQASLGLWVAAMALGAYGGRTARRARHLAKSLASEGDEPSSELRGLVSARGPLYASYASFLLLLAILVLMVWRPGSSSQAARPVVFPQTLRQEILGATPQLAYLPTRLPSGVQYAFYTPEPDPSRGFRLTFNGSDGQHEVSFSVYRSGAFYPDQCSPPRKDVLRSNGYRIGFDRSTGAWSVWRCVGHGNATILLQADAMQLDVNRDDLVTVVAYAEPIG